MNKIYAGIGSRETPPACLEIMAILAGRLGKAGWTLRSGRAKGADSAFEAGARAVRGKCEIFLPEDLRPLSMRDNEPPKARYMDEVDGSCLGAKLIARLLHPNGKNLKPDHLELHARNTYQIIGQDMNTPADLVICYTVGGRGEGGTGQALRLAKMCNIPILDFGVYDTPDGWWLMNEHINSMYGVSYGT